MVSPRSLYIGLLCCLSLTALVSAGNNTMFSIVMLAELTTSLACPENDEISIQRMAEVLTADYIINQVKKEGSNYSSLAVPELDYELRIEDICEGGNGTLFKTLASWLHLSPEMTNQNHSQPLAVLGSVSKGNLLKTLGILNGLPVPVLSPTRAVPSSDAKGHDNFFRTGLSVEAEVKAMLIFLTEHKWSYVTLVYTKDNIGYAGFAIMKDMSKQMGICFATVLAVDIVETGSRYYESLVNDITIYREANITLYYGSTEPAVRLLNAYINMPLTYEKTMLFPTSVGKSQEIMKMKRTAWPIIMVLTPQPQTESIMAPIKLHIEEVIENPRERYKKLLDKCPRCEHQEKINFENLIYTVYAITSILYANKLTYDNPSSMHQNSDRNELQISNNPMIGNLYANDSKTGTSFDQSRRIVFNESQPLLGICILNQEEADNHVYEQIYLLQNERFIRSGNHNITANSRCTKAENCEQCVRPKLKYIYIPGDFDSYVVVGTGGLSDPDGDHKTCGKTISPVGMVRALAFYFGHKEFQNVAKKNISTLYIDTCSTELHTYNMLQEIFGDRKANLVDIYGHKHAIPLSKFVLVIGDIDSAVTIAIQSYLRLLAIPQISPGSTTHWLDDEERYPNFLRLTPSDIHQVKNILTVCRDNNIKAVGLITTDSTYGNSGRKLIQQSVGDYKICIEYDSQIGRSKTSVEKVARELCTDDQLPRAFIYFGDERRIPELLKQMQISDSNKKWRNSGRVIIASKTWGRSLEAIHDVEDMTYGFMTFSLATNFTWKTNAGDQFEQYLSSLNAQNMKHHESFIQFWQQRFQCYMPMSGVIDTVRECSDCNLIEPSSNCPVDIPLETEDIFAKFNVIAWLTLAYAIERAEDMEISIHVLFDNSSSSRETYVEILRETSIPPELKGEAKTLEVFKHASNQGVANYDVYNIQKDDKDKAQYKLIYSFRGNDFKRLATPTFYIGEDVDTNPFSSDCYDNECSKCPETKQPVLSTNNSCFDCPPPSETRYQTLITRIYAVVVAIIIFQIISTAKDMACNYIIWRHCRRDPSQSKDKELQDTKDNHNPPIKLPPQPFKKHEGPSPRDTIRTRDRYTPEGVRNHQTEDIELRPRRAPDRIFRKSTALEIEVHGEGAAVDIPVADEYSKTQRAAPELPPRVPGKETANMDYDYAKGEQPQQKKKVKESDIKAFDRPRSKYTTEKAKRRSEMQPDLHLYEDLCVDPLGNNIPIYDQPSFKDPNGDNYQNIRGGEAGEREESVSLSRDDPAPDNDLRIMESAQPISNVSTRSGTENPAYISDNEILPTGHTMFELK